jgi:AraC-like DNA-binding protein
MNMRLQNITPHPLLKDYISKLWIFESSGRVPDSDMKLIVPNGLIKLVIPFRNGLSGTMEGWSHLSKEHSITLIGMTDIPSVVEAESDEPAGTIGVEFSPVGAYRVFHLPQSEIRNQIHPLENVLGKVAKELEEKIGNAKTVEGKVALLQEFFIRQLQQKSSDEIFDHCISRIISSKGKQSISELERSTGYSARWLNMKFTEKVGVSPKNLASIVRFQQFYQAWITSSERDFFKDDFYDYYYDQSHFIKDFKRFTGLAPRKFAVSENEFGRIFYKG